MTAKKKTIGKMSNSRMMWEINPVNRIKPGKRKEMNRRKTKEMLKSGKWDD